MILFSWVRIFLEWAKLTHSWYSKKEVVVFSFIIHIENRYIVGTRIRGSDHSWKQGNLVYHENWAINFLNQPK